MTVKRSIFVASTSAALATAQPLAAIAAIARDNEYDLTTPTGTLSGTLRLPQTPGPSPVALIIGGSGPVDRNGNGGGLALNMYEKLAAALAANGIATVRYDKRGVGLSQAAGPANEADIRFDTYLDDAVGWIVKLRADGRFAHVGIIGHSEGALIGMLAAQRTAVDAYVSLEGASLTLLDTVRRQLNDRLAALPQLAGAANRICDALRAGKTVPQGDIPPELMALFRPSIQPFMRSENKYDPCVEIAKVRAPTTIVQGTHDIQVTVDDGHALASALPTATFALLEDMTHVLTDDPGTTLAAQATGAYADPSRPLNARLVPVLTKALTQT